MVSTFTFLASYFLVLFSLFIFIILAYIFRKTYHSKSSSPKIPGIKVPFYSFYGTARFLPSYSTMRLTSLPESSYIQQICSGLATMFCNEKIIGNKFAFQDIIILTKAESVEEFFTMNAQATKPYKEILASFFGNGLFLSTGQKWKAQKKAVTPLFHQSFIKEFFPVFDSESKVLVDILKSRQHKEWIDIKDPVTLCSMDISCVTFLGVKLGAQKQKNLQYVNAVERVMQTTLKRMMNPIYYFERIFRLSATGRQFEKDMKVIRAFAEQAIQQRKNAVNGGKKNCDLGKTRSCDFLRLLLDIHKGNSEYLRSEKDFRDEVISLMFAGQDTTASGMSWALYLIGLYPDVQRKIHEELDTIFADDTDRPVTLNDLKEMCYLECVVKESLRLYPSVPFLAKHIVEDITLCGYKIKKGSIIVVDNFSFHRNPEVFPNPEVFDPDRFLPEKCAGRNPYAYVPFSAGIRSCIGRLYAMMEMKVVLANVLRCFSLTSLEHRDKICVTPDLILRTPQPLKMRFLPRDAK